MLLITHGNHTKKNNPISIEVRRVTAPGGAEEPVDLIAGTHRNFYSDKKGEYGVLRFKLRENGYFNNYYKIYLKYTDNQDKYNINCAIHFDFVVDSESFTLPDSYFSETAPNTNKTNREVTMEQFQEDCEDNGDMFYRVATLQSVTDDGTGVWEVYDEGMKLKEKANDGLYSNYNVDASRYKLKKKYRADILIYIEFKGMNVDENKWVTAELLNPEGIEGAIRVIDGPHKEVDNEDRNALIVQLSVQNLTEHNYSLTLPIKIEFRCYSFWGQGAAVVETWDHYQYQLNIQFSVGDEEKRGQSTFTDVTQNISAYEPSEGLSVTDVGKMENKIGYILTVITNIGIVLTVIVIAVIGVKYMLASAEEKAEYKKDLAPYLLGSILIFGVCTIVKILQGIGSGFN